MEARDLWFTPAALTVSSSEHWTIRLKNAGRVVHNLTVDELGIVIVVAAGEVGEATVTDIEPGTYSVLLLDLRTSGGRHGGHAHRPVMVRWALTS